MTMTLRAFIDQSRYSRREFAEELGVTESCLNKWFYGYRIPRPKQIAAIEALTLGMVKVDDLIAAYEAHKQNTLTKEGNNATQAKAGRRPNSPRRNGGRSTPAK